MIIIGSIGGNEADKEESSAATETTTTRAFTTTRPPMPGIGQEARDGKFAFAVTGVETAKTVGDPSGDPYMQATAQGVYVVVSMTVKNIGNESQAFFAANQKLTDTAGREYSPDSQADMWINTAIQTDINPGNQIQAKVAFDVPEGTQPSAMELHDSAFSGGVTVSVS